jgi:hypothetical protein
MQQGSEGRGSPIGTAVGVVGGALLVAGSFLTWVTLSGGGDSVSAKGTDGSDGWITFGAGLVLIAVSLAAMRAGRRALAILAIVAALAGGGIGVYDALTVRDQIAEDVADQSGITTEQARTFIDQSIDAGEFELSVGAGIFLVIGGGVLGLIGGAMLMTGGARPPGMPAEVGSAPMSVGYPPAQEEVAPPAHDVAPPSGPPPAPPPPPPPPGSPAN